MKLKFIVAVIAIAAVPFCAQAQKPAAKKVTKADAQKVVKIISADKAKTQTYCDMAKLGDQIEQADQKKDTKKVDELSKKMDDDEPEARPRIYRADGRPAGHGREFQGRQGHRRRARRASTSCARNSEAVSVCANR